MYAKYFGLAELPFRITPDPRFLWYSDQHQSAKEKILYHVRQSVGPIYLLAPVGAGKTTLAKRIVQELSVNGRNRVVYVFAPKITTTNGFLRFVMDEFKVKTERAYASSLQSFEQFLLEQHNARVSPVLLIDEAQNMTRDMLLLIQHFFNFSTDTEFLIQMVLFAQPDFRAKLKRLPSLKSRLNVSKLRAFDQEQTKQMMQFRWTVAGGKALPFDDEAIAKMYRLTEGVPRSIVTLANEALVLTAVQGKRKVTKKVVAEAQAELDAEKL